MRRNHLPLEGQDATRNRRKDSFEASSLAILTLASADILHRLGSET